MPSHWMNQIDYGTVVDCFMHRYFIHYNIAKYTSITHPFFTMMLRYFYLNVFAVEHRPPLPSMHRMTNTNVQNVFRKYDISNGWYKNSLVMFARSNSMLFKSDVTEPSAESKGYEVQYFLFSRIWKKWFDRKRSVKCFS